MRGAFRHRDFRLLFAGSVAVSFVMPMQFLTQIFWIQDRYPDHSVLFAGMLAASRGSAGLIFGLLGGAFADRFERRRVLLASQVVSLSVGALVALVMIMEPFGAANIAALLGLTFIAAGNMAVDQPARTAATPAIVGMKDLSSAITLQMVAMQVTFPLALPLTGYLNDLMDPGKVYALTLLAWAIILPLIAMLRFQSRGEANRATGIIGNIREGLGYTRRDATISAVILLVLAVQVLGMPGPAHLGPLWMTDVLGLSSTQFGFMAMTWGFGTFAASFFFAFRKELAGRGATLCVAVLLFAGGAIIFGHSRIIALTAFANFALGFGSVATSVTSATIVQHTVSDEMRGRVMGLFPLAHGLSMLAGFPASAASQALGMAFVFPVLAWATLAAAFGVIGRRPTLRTIKPAAATPAAVAGSG